MQELDKLLASDSVSGIYIKDDIFFLYVVG